MKKFLLTSLAALFAVVSFAQVGVKKQVVTLANDPVPVAKVMDRQSAVKNLKAPQGRKVLGKSAPRRAAISSIDELQGEFIVCNYEYVVDTVTNKLTPAPVSRKGISANIEVTGENTIAIYGIDDNVTETAITATVDVENSTITIPANQLIWTYTDKESGEKTDFLMTNASTEGDFTGTIYEGGVIELNEVWYEGFVEEGETYRNGNYKGTIIAPTNGIMEYSSTDEDDQPIQVSQNVLIEQDDETKEVTVWNVHNFITGMVMDVNINTDKSFSVPGGEQVVYMHSTLNEIYLWGSPKAGSIDDITGKVVDNTKLVSETGFGYVNASYRGWVYPDDKFTITLVDGSEFTYPGLEIGELVTPPADLQAKEYPFSATLYAPKAEDYTATVKIGIDGNNVYIQGLDKDLPEAWIKGEYNEAKTKVAFPVTYTGLVGEDEVHYFAAYGGSDGPDSLFVNYDADADTYDYGAMVMIYKGTKPSAAYAYFYNGFFIGEKPTPVVAPEGLETKEMPFTGKKYNSSSKELEDVEGHVNVGIDGENVYIQGLFEEVPEGWMKGTLTTIEGAQYVLFEKNQYVGNLDNGLSAYLVGYAAATGETPASAYYALFSYDAANNVFKSLNPILLTRFKDNISASRCETYFSSGLTIGTDPTGIVAAKADAKGNAQMYNLAGQKVGKDYKGLVIKNGVKMIQK